MKRALIHSGNLNQIIGFLSVMVDDFQAKPCMLSSRSLRGIALEINHFIPQLQECADALSEEFLKEKSHG